MDQEQVLSKYMEILRQKLIKKYLELGLKASGDYEDQLEAVVDPNKAIMYGAFHSQFMEFGRDPGKFPPRSAIEDWIDSKPGLPSIFREKKSQMVFLISRKIANEGITVPNEYNKVKVVSEVVEEFLEKDIEEMLQELGEVYLPIIQSQVLKMFKEISITN